MQDDRTPAPLGGKWRHCSVKANSAETSSFHFLSEAGVERSIHKIYFNIIIDIYRAGGQRWASHMLGNCFVCTVSHILNPWVKYLDCYVLLWCVNVLLGLLFLWLRSSKTSWETHQWKKQCMERSRICSLSSSSFLPSYLSPFLVPSLPLFLSEIGIVISCCFVI